MAEALNTREIMELKDIHRSFKLGRTTQDILQGIDLTIHQGEMLLLLGKSGSGKTTLLNQLGGIDNPSEGHIYYFGDDITKFNDRQMTRFRSKNIGWIFQFFNLIPSLTALENVGLGLELAQKYEDMDKLSKEMLQKVGLQDKINLFPSQLSGGQQQRVAIARALVKKPQIVLADEPTGNLDTATGLEIVNLMKGLKETEKTTFIIASHDKELIKFADRILYITDGKITEQHNRL